MSVKYNDLIKRSKGELAVMVLELHELLDKRQSVLSEYVKRYGVQSRIDDLSELNERVQRHIAEFKESTNG